MTTRSGGASPPPPPGDMDPNETVSEGGGSADWRLVVSLSVCAMVLLGVGAAVFWSQQVAEEERQAAERAEAPAAADTARWEDVEIYRVGPEHQVLEYRRAVDGFTLVCVSSGARLHCVPGRGALTLQRRGEGGGSSSP